MSALYCRRAVIKLPSPTTTPAPAMAAIPGDWRMVSGRIDELILSFAIKSPPSQPSSPAPSVIIKG